MYKLLLVDDEEEVRRGILNKIDWNSLGFEIAGEAENGREALYMAKKTLPDVVLTDIKMPFMNGLELAEELKVKLPTAKIIILTGFDEFEFARKAIGLNVVEYALKPVSADDINNMLLKVKKKLDMEKEERESLERLKENFLRSLPVLKEKFLSSLVEGKTEAGEVMEKAELYGLNIKNSLHRIAVVEIVEQKSEPENMEGLEKLKRRELLNLSILEIVDEIVSKYGQGPAFIYDGRILVFLSWADDNALLNEIKQYIGKYFDVEISIGLGSLAQGPDQLNRSYITALSALDYRFYLGTNRIISIDDIEPASGITLRFDGIKEQAFHRAIKVGSCEELEQTTSDLLIEIQKSKTSFKNSQVYLMEILLSMLRVAEDYGVSADIIFGKESNLFSDLRRISGFREAKEWFFEKGRTVQSKLFMERQDTSTQIAKMAKEFAHENYVNSGLSINMVCKHLHISPAYLSTVFKKETKHTFMNYLQNIRMEKAKELLRSTDLKAFEISEKIGYSESNYFSYCFKKSEGISPSEYRSGGRG